MDGLRPADYQLVALTKVISNGLNGILISDGVGVGKTIAAAYLITYFSNQKVYCRFSVSGSYQTQLWGIWDWNSKIRQFEGFTGCYRYKEN